MKLKTGDKVLVIAGKEKGKTGNITKIIKKEDRVIIGGINIVKKHVKANQKDQTGGIIDIEAPIHISNVKLVSAKEADKAKKEVLKKEKSTNKETKKTTATTKKTTKTTKTVKKSKNED